MRCTTFEATASPLSFRRSMKPLLSLLLLGLLAAGRTTTGAAGGAPTSAIVGPTWTLAQLGAVVLTNSTATVVFGADGRVNGSTGCNSFFGTYTLAPTGALALSQVGSTRMACAGPEMAVEARVLDALNRADRAVVQGGRLVLMAGTESLAAFETAGTASASVSGTVAYRERIALPPNAVVTVRLLDVSRADAAATTIAETVIQTNGRQVPIPFTLAYDPSRIEARNRYVVRATIGDAAGVMLFTTDTAVPVVTNGGMTFGFELMLVQGVAMGVGPGVAPGLSGTSWRLVEIAGASGVALTFDGAAPYTLTFNADGTASGQVDCNRFSGPFTAMPSGSLAFGATAATLAACPEPSASGDFFDVFNTVNGYRVDGGRLTLDGAGGTLTFVGDR